MVYSIPFRLALGVHTGVIVGKTTGKIFSRTIEINNEDKLFKIRHQFIGNRD